MHFKLPDQQLMGVTHHRSNDQFQTYVVNASWRDPEAEAKQKLKALLADGAEALEAKKAELAAAKDAFGAAKDDVGQARRALDQATGYRDSLPDDEDAAELESAGQAGRDAQAAATAAEAEAVTARDAKTRLAAEVDTLERRLAEAKADDGTSVVEKVARFSSTA